MFIALTVVDAENQLYPNKIKASSKYSRQIVGVCDIVFDLFENLFLAYFAIGWLANYQPLDRQSPASSDDRHPMWCHVSAMKSAMNLNGSIFDITGHE